MLVEGACILGLAVDEETPATDLSTQREGSEYDVSK